MLLYRHMLRRCMTHHTKILITCGNSADSSGRAYKNVGLDIDSDIKSLASILVTDPPYCLLERRRKTGELRDAKHRPNKTDSKDEIPRYSTISTYRQFTRSWLNISTRFLTPNAPLIIWSNFMGRKVIEDVCSELGYKLVGEYLWAKSSTVNNAKSILHKSNYHPLTKHGKSELTLRAYESALIFSNLESTKNEMVDVRGTLMNRSMLPWTVATEYHDTGSLQPHDHPCHKPLAALEPLLRTWIRNEDVVLDPFAGSGGILSSLLQISSDSDSSDREFTRLALTNWSYRGIEILPYWHKYCQSISMDYSESNK